MKEKQKILLLIILTILTFILGMKFEIDYRILTRKTVSYFANYKIEYYGGKDFRFFETDIAFILTLIPIGIYFVTLKIEKLKTKVWLTLNFLFLIPFFYFLYCFLESKYIKITSMPTIIDNEILKYHHNNLNYRIILFLTLISTFVFEIVLKRKMEHKKASR